MRNKTVPDGTTADVVLDAKGLNWTGFKQRHAKIGQKNSHMFVGEQEGEGFISFFIKKG